MKFFFYILGNVIYKSFKRSKKSLTRGLFKVWDLFYLKRYLYLNLGNKKVVKALKLSFFQR